MDEHEIPLEPPAAWFAPPSEGIPTDKRITILAGGQVYGYIALWDTCHVGHNSCVRPPQGSPTNYDYAHQGETLTAEGDLIKTAVIAGGLGHAPVDMDTALVPSYYENTGTQLMRVRYGEDDNGLWFAGALWPGVADLQVAQIRASSISGDWRFHAAWRRAGSQYDFAGACFVNIPGFPMKDQNGISDRSGSPFALAASALNLDEKQEYVFLDNDGVYDMCGKEGEGECTNCTCVKEDVSVELDADTLEELQAAGYQLHGKKLKKNPKTIKADADLLNSDTENPIDIQTLTATVMGIKDAVDWLVSSKLYSEIIETEA